MDSQLLQKHHLKQVNRSLEFSIGDKVRVHYKIKEGAKERIQKYEGTVIAIKNKGAGRSLTVYRVSYDVGVERVFPLYAPTVEKIETLRSSRVRRAKLYYLKDKMGKQARLKEIKKEPKPDSDDKDTKKLKNDKDTQKPKSDKDAQKPKSDKGAQKPKSDKDAKKSKSDKGVQKPKSDKDTKKSKSDRDAKKSKSDKGTKKPKKKSSES